MNVKLIIALILAGLAVIFTIQNVTIIKLRFLFWTLSMSGALLMFLILSAGIILGWLLHEIFIRRKSRAHDKQETVTDIDGYLMIRKECHRTKFGFNFIKAQTSDRYCAQAF